MEISLIDSQPKLSAYLDDTVFPRRGIKGVLNVALANDAKMPDDINGGSAEHVIINI